MNVITKSENDLLLKDTENNYIWHKHDIVKLVADMTSEELYNTFSNKEIMEKISTKTLLLIYEKIIDTKYNNSEYILLWHLELLTNNYVKVDSELKIALYDIINNLEFNNTSIIQNLLIKNKIYIEKYLVSSHFTLEQLSILRLDEEKIIFNDETKNSEEFLSAYSDYQIYNDFFCSKEFITNLRSYTLTYIFNRIINSEYNKNEYLLSWQLDVLLINYNFEQTTNKKKIEKIIVSLNYKYSDEIITILIKNIFYWEKMFSNKELTNNKFCDIVKQNVKLGFSSKNTDKFTDVVDFFVCLNQNHKLKYNLLKIENFNFLIKYNAKHNSEYLYYKYYNKTSELGFYIGYDKCWHRC